MYHSGGRLESTDSIRLEAGQKARMDIPVAVELLPIRYGALP